MGEILPQYAWWLHDSLPLVVLSQLTLLRDQGMAQEKEVIKGNYWPLNREHKFRLSIQGRGF